MSCIKGLARVAGIAALTTMVVAVPFGAGASVRREGAWPAAERLVSFEFEGKPSEGLQKLAHEADWSLVLSRGVAEGEPDVHISVKDQPADAVLEALFAEADVVARRTGTLITVSKDGAATGSAAAAAQPDTSARPDDSAATPAVDGAPVPPVPTVRGEDREIIGGDLTIPSGEVVHSVSVTGGSVVIEGTVTGDLVVTGGSAVVKERGRIVGDATVFGGSLRLEPGARVDGHAGVVGGVFERRPGSFVGGKVHGARGSVEKDGDESDGNVVVGGDHEPARGRLAQAAHDLAQRLTKLSLLFVLGCVLLALAGKPMDRLRTEVATRPMRAFALGVLASIAAVITIVVLCVTIIGIPVALVGVLLGAFAIYGSVAAVLTTLGAAVIGHRTDNVYLHLLLGTACLFVVGALPYVGGLVTFALGMISVGILVSTKVGGLLEKRRARTLV